MPCSARLNPSAARSLFLSFFRVSSRRDQRQRRFQRVRPDYRLLGFSSTFFFSTVSPFFPAHPDAFSHRQRGAASTLRPSRCQATLSAFLLDRLATRSFLFFFVASRRPSLQGPSFSGGAASTSSSCGPSTLFSSLFFRPTAAWFTARLSEGGGFYARLGRPSSDWPPIFATPWIRSGFAGQNPNVWAITVRQ
jgi:hypothetical protein